MHAMPLTVKSSGCSLALIVYRNIFFLVDEVDVGVAAVVFDLDDVGQVDVVVDTENGKNGSKPA